MLQLLLSNGTSAGNSELLNSRIQVANLIALISVVTVGLYTPLYFVVEQPAGVINNLFFCAVSGFVFPLLRQKRYRFAFHWHVVGGYIYFICGTLLFGISTNLHLFLIAMSMIVAVLFDCRKTIFGYTVFGIVALTGLILYFNWHGPFVSLPQFAAAIQHWISNVNLILLAVICFIFVLFFKNRLLSDQDKLFRQKNELEAKNLEIRESLTYSKRIQSALQPKQNELSESFPEHVLLYRPKDIVSGDFYLVLETEQYRFAIVADCTGHGVPGALMSVLGITLLKQIVLGRHCVSPAAILEMLRTEIISGLGKDENDVHYKDGMDISVLRLEQGTGNFLVASANNPVFHVSGGTLAELSPSRQSIGFSYHPRPFNEIAGEYKKGDWFFLSSDGFVDQFGGPKGKKFMLRRFRESLLAFCAEEKNLADVIDEWKGDLEQTDDICLLGVKCEK